MVKINSKKFIGVDVMNSWIEEAGLSAKSILNVTFIPPSPETLGYYELLYLANRELPKRPTSYVLCNLTKESNG